MLLTESLLGTSSTAANYIEDVFSTYLYTGTASAQTITNGIDLSGKGGMVWLKSRSGADSHYIVDTARGSNKVIYSNLTIAEETLTRFSSFNSNGFSLSTTPSNPNVNGYTYASWTFRKQAKFFDVVTYTGNGANRTIAHNLGSVPGCIIVKCTSDITDWGVYHRSLTSAAYALQLNTTGAQFSNVGYWNSTAPTSSVFSVGTDNDTNANGRTYVAYLFAHDAGGFGAAGTDNVISCGSFTKSAGVEATITLGYEPQWLLFKRTDAAENWFMIDNMRGMTVGGTDAYLIPNLSSAENNLDFVTPTATGFIATNNFNTGTYIYIAIRRGPMKTPTSGTSVYNAIARTGNGTYSTYVSGAGFPVDLAWAFSRSSSAEKHNSVDRLRGPVGLFTQSTEAENSSVDVKFDRQDGIVTPALTNNGFNNNAVTYIQWFFRRAPGFFDVVCYTGTGASATLNHNLGVAPNMVIIKGRSVISNWETYLSSLGGTGGNGLAINDSGAKSGTPPVSSATATTFTLNNGVSTSSGQTYVAYLFATLAGVSKVGSYTGTGTTQQINCGFTAGARFVLIKRTDSTGDWYVWDSARGIVAGNDPYLLLNSTAAEVTGTDYVDTYSAGFEISSTAPAAINANGGSFIFLAIA